jgi:hypothetical protein
LCLHILNNNRRLTRDSGRHLGRIQCNSGLLGAKSWHLRCRRHEIRAAMFTA